MIDLMKRILTVSGVYRKRILLAFVFSLSSMAMLFSMRNALRYSRKLHPISSLNTLEKYRYADGTGRPFTTDAHGVFH